MHREFNDLDYSPPYMVCVIIHVVLMVEILERIIGKNKSIANRLRLIISPIKAFSNKILVATYTVLVARLSMCTFKYDSELELAIANCITITWQYS